MNAPRRALLSVTDKTHLVEFAQGLVDLGLEIVSTGGTARVLEEGGVPVTKVSDVTGFPEILDGRVKTLHPKVHGGILARRNLDSDVEALKQHEITPFEVVAVNLYAFEEAAADPNKSADDTIEQIDIGGPTLLRAAAKNHMHVVPVVDPRDYEAVLAGLKSPDGVDAATRRTLALKVFRHTAHYDRAVSNWLEGLLDGASSYPESLTIEVRKVNELRYGENPHQTAALYRDTNPPPGSLAAAKQLHGKALSYNNLLDADSAWGLAVDLGEHAAVYVKHNNPCGAATHPDLAQALQLARAVDSTSAFGAVVATTRRINGLAASVLAETFIEVVVAPSFDAEALEILTRKKNLRLVQTDGLYRPGRGVRDLRRISGGLLVQSKDVRPDPLAELEGAKVVTERAPTDEERAALAFNWLVAKHVRSNAIVFGHADRVVGIGAGQMSRVDSVRLCGLKAGDALKGTVVASDAFFPFRDGVDILAESGATAIVQPGGSIRDEEVIAAANEHGLAMVTTGVRHFRH